MEEKGTFSELTSGHPGRRVEQDVPARRPRQLRQQKKPRTRPGLFSQVIETLEVTRRDRRGVEAPVHADADEIVVQRHRAAVEGGAEVDRVESLVFQIDVEIFDLGRPIRQETPFDAAADGPAVARVVRGIDHCAGGGRVHTRLGTCYGPAAGGVEQRIVGGKADPAANGGEPVFLGEVGKAGHAGRAILDRGTALADPRDVAFEAEHPARGLPVEAGGHAAEAAIDVVIVAGVEAGRRSDLPAAAPGSTAFDTGVKSAPVIQRRSCDRYRVLDPWTGGHIGCRRCADA